MAGLLPFGFLQFLDANGNPLAGGSVGYFDPASPGTLKAIFADPGQATPVSNPVVLDTAGRPATGGSEVGIWGTGQYLMTVRNNVGALQWTALTVSDITTADLAAETAARVAADNSINSQLAVIENALGTIEAAIAVLENDDTTLINNLAAETAARTAADTNLQNQINAFQPGGASGNVTAKTGSSVTASTGELSVVFPAFPTHALSFVVDVGQPIGAAGNIPRFTLWNIFANSARGLLEITDGTGTFGPAQNVNFTWYASGY
jgi:hypothetical protein